MPLSFGFSNGLELEINNLREMLKRMSQRSFHTGNCHWKKESAKIVKGKSHSSNQWLSRQIADPFVQLAKMQNFRCRSAFKLLEINEKANLLTPGKTVIDCGAAPGSWTEIAVEKTNALGKNKRQPVGFVIGLDLLNIYPVEGAHVLGNADFRLPETQDHVKRLLDGRKIDCVLSDMAPNATGVRALDQDNIVTLCYTVLRFAIMMSSPQASLLVKLWDNGEVHKIEKDMLKYYKYVKHIKPKASRSESSEKFLLATDFYGLKTDTQSK